MHIRSFQPNYVDDSESYLASTMKIAMIICVNMYRLTTHIM